MPSEKVLRILLARGVSAEAVDAMSEGEAWKTVYALGNVRVVRPPAPLQICFTGFSDEEKAALSSLAQHMGLRVVSGVTKTLSLLCAGENAGPSKLAKAGEQGARVLDREKFYALIEQGEFPG